MFFYETGDAAGNNLAGDATAACIQWIKDHVTEEVPNVIIQEAWIEVLGKASGDKTSSPIPSTLGEKKGCNTKILCLNDFISTNCSANLSSQNSVNKIQTGSHLIPVTF